MDEEELKLVTGAIAQAVEAWDHSPNTLYLTANLSVSEVEKYKSAARAAIDAVDASRDDGESIAATLKVLICDCLIDINNEGEPGHPIIPPTAIDWVANRIIEAILKKDNE